MDPDKQYSEASIKTAETLRSIARLQEIRDLSRLSLPEVDSVVDQVAQVVPAGNVPGVILSGLARLSKRKLPFDTVKRDINLLFKGAEQVLNTSVYSAFFAGPAAVIWGYQNLLKLVGRNPDDAFPEGTWQFYADYALREDTARHATETHGFDTLLGQHGVALSPVDRLTAWTMAAIYCLHHYSDLLENEWRERVYIRLLREVTAEMSDDVLHYARLYRDWEQQRPYGRDQDSEPTDTYPVYRRRKFDRFLEEATQDLPADLRRQWQQQIEAAEAEELPAYQQQMSILAYLDPSAYGETRVPIELSQAYVGLIQQGRYYLIPACTPQTEQPSDIHSVRTQIATLLHYPAEFPAAPLAALVGIKRASLAGLRDKLHQELIGELNTLRLFPILLNFDIRSADVPLAALRQAERGIGDHALTLFDTGQSFVFDQSHIFFDGTWGAALAEIMTNEALSWAAYLRTLPPAEPGDMRPYAPGLQLHAAEQKLVEEASGIIPEATAETDAVDLAAILNLRRLFKQRSDLLQLTVNDLLLLYRAIHAATYKPDPAMMNVLEIMTREETTRPAAEMALAAIRKAGETNPAVVMPVDASQRSPRDRLYPMTFEVPLADLDLLKLHRRVMAALEAYQHGRGDRTALYAEFDELQRKHLSLLAGFGQVLSRIKAMAITGQSASVNSIKLLAYMPTPLQRMLDRIPGSFDILNDILKGREVFSNVGAVAPDSTLIRFMTAKDDNDKKTLAWGIITDAGNVMRISLRDFRPHVGLLKAIGRQDLANQVIQDYLDAYAEGLNRFIEDLRQITQSSRETRPRKPEQLDV